jgi:hypothetical protein
MTKKKKLMEGEEIVAYLSYYPEFALKNQGESHVVSVPPENQTSHL